MTDNKAIVEKLSLFNNRSFTKKQWEIIFEGCGCPKTPFFWKALRDNNMQVNKRIFTLVDMNTESFDKVWSAYCNFNRKAVKKSYDKKKIMKRAAERKYNFKGVTLYLVDGCLTDTKPSRD